MGKVFQRRKKKDLGEVSPALSGQYYQQLLPAAQIPFSSPHGRRLFEEALRDGNMENYFHMAEQFRTQDEPTFCGLTTLAMVLNSLRIDPMRTWKGAWRWYSEKTLSCECTGLDRVRAEGMTFDLFRSLATCNGASVGGKRAPAGGGPEAWTAFVDDFRAALTSVCSSRDRESLVICYSRELLGQRGAGHFSPIGGFHRASDMVLILDVARFRYPPHWAPVTDVARAMADVDRDTGKPRGFLHMRLQMESDQPLRQPVYVRFIPTAAGRRLSAALLSSLAEQCPLLLGEPPLRVAMERWLRAASEAEPQVLLQLLQVGDPAALIEVLGRLQHHSLFEELCVAYEEIASRSAEEGIEGKFPPLLRHRPDLIRDEMSLQTCGELWIVLLLLMPEHIRGAVSRSLAGAAVGQQMAATVRGPWALPLEYVRETLRQLIPESRTLMCGDVQPTLRGL